MAVSPWAKVLEGLCAGPFWHSSVCTGACVRRGTVQAVTPAVTMAAFTAEPLPQLEMAGTMQSAIACEKARALSLRV